MPRKSNLLPAFAAAILLLTVTSAFAGLDPKAPPMPDQMAEDLVRLTTDMRTQQQNLQPALFVPVSRYQFVVWLVLPRTQWSW